MSLTIRSRDGASIAFETIDGSRFRASLSGNGIHATTDVWFRDYLGLNAFFSDLAANWKGWPSEKVWESDEGEFSIRASSNRLGHVTLQTELLTRVDPVWRLELSVLIEAGQLEAISKDVAILEKSLFAAA